MIKPLLEEAARTFALQLRASLPITNFWRAKALMQADEEAQNLLRELQQCQQSLLRKQQNGDRITQEEITALRRLQEKVQRNPAVMNYIQTRQQAQAFLSQVNLEISQLLGFDFGSLVRTEGC